MEKKLRIQLFDSEGRLASDRLVSQDPEISKGPQFVHPDPIRVEFTITSKGDVEMCKTYLDQLSGQMPLQEKKKRKAAIIHDEDNREDFLINLMGAVTNQDDLIKELRALGFMFMTYEYLKTLGFDVLEIKGRHQTEYQWMIKCLKQGKNPKTDKYDPMLLFGIQLMGDRVNKIVVYLNGIFYKKYDVLLPDKPQETFKKSGMVKFPPYMIESEREKFRFELRKLKLEPKREPSKFLLRWLPYVENLKPELYELGKK